MSLMKSIVFFALVAFAAGTVFKPKPVKRFEKPIATGISSREACGDQYITGTGGNFYSPNYPEDYDAGVSCGWFLTAENGGRIAVGIVDMQTEPSFDYVIIRDGVSGNSPVLAELSGSISNLALLSTQSSIFVGFFTDGSIVDRGFNISWRQTDLAGNVNMLELFQL